MELTAYSQQSWTLLQKVAFRFFTCLFIAYLFPFPLDSFPFIGEIVGISEKLQQWYGAPFEAYTNMWHAIIPWVGKSLLGLKTPITVFTNGSGDTTYDYVLLLTTFVLAIIGCVVWSILDRRRRSYNTAYYWIRVGIRYYLAAAMFGYGFAKVFHLQMSSPYLSQLVQPYGDKSPMGIAWSFFGYSPAYSAFTGWSEVIGGVFLLFRRTTSLGALVVSIVMLNVAVINYCFDVPVKLYSSMLFLMAVFLLAPAFRKLVAVFVTHKPIAPETFPPMLESRRMKIIRGVFKLLIIASLLYSNISGNISAKKQYGDDRKKPPLYGIYNAELTIINNDTLAPVITDSTQWRQLVIQFEKFAQVKMMNDSMKRMSFVVNDTIKTIVMAINPDTVKSTLRYQLDSNALVITGRLKADSVYMRFRRYDEKKFRLLSRGFNWINEYPYNR